MKNTQFEPIEMEISKAVHRYRVRIQNEKKRGPFHNMRAIIRTNKEENMRNLIEAGHGEVLSIQNKYVLWNEHLIWNSFD